MCERSSETSPGSGYSAPSSIHSTSITLSTQKLDFALRAETSSPAPDSESTPNRRLEESLSIEFDRSNKVIVVALGRERLQSFSTAEPCHRFDRRSALGRIIEAKKVYERFIGEIYWVYRVERSSTEVIMSFAPGPVQLKASGAFCTVLYPWYNVASAWMMQEGRLDYEGEAASYRYDFGAGPDMRRASIVVEVADTCPVDETKLAIMKDDPDLQYIVIVNIGNYQRGGGQPSYLEVVIHEKGVQSPRRFNLLKDCSAYGQKTFKFSAEKLYHGVAVPPGTKDAELDMFFLKTVVCNAIEDA